MLLGEGQVQGAISFSSLLSSEAGVRGAGEPAWDWDTAPVCLMFTTRAGKSKAVHRNNNVKPEFFSFICL